MGRRERNRPGFNALSNAAAAITDRARNDPRFKAAIEETFRVLDDARIETWGVEKLKQLGGLSTIIQAKFESLVGDAEAPGSQIFGDTRLSSVLFPEDIANIRSRLQRAAQAREVRQLNTNASGSTS